MWIRHLSLTNFRNYRRQELDLPRGPVLLLGDNAQGKSNLLEAVFLLATTRSERVQTDGELIHWDALGEAQPVARVSAQIERGDGLLELEGIVVGRPRGGAGRGAGAAGARPPPPSAPAMPRRRSPCWRSAPARRTTGAAAGWRSFPLRISHASRAGTKSACAPKGKDCPQLCSR